MQGHGRCLDQLLSGLSLPSNYSYEACLCGLIWWEVIAFLLQRLKQLISGSLLEIFVNSSMFDEVYTVKQIHTQKGPPLKIKSKYAILIARLKCLKSDLVSLDRSYN